MSSLAPVGYLLQLLGLAIAAIGLSDTWRHHAPAEARFLGRPRALLRAAVTSPMRPIRALIRRRAHRPANAQAGLADGLGVAEGVREVVTYGPLDAASPDAIDRLARRTVELRVGLNRLDDRERADADVLRRDLEALQADTTREIEKQRKLIEDVATRGTGLATFGLVVTFIGTVILALG
jgi:hypothetical protein